MAATRSDNLRHHGRRFNPKRENEFTVFARLISARARQARSRFQYRPTKNTRDTKVSHLQSSSFERGFSTMTSRYDGCVKNDVLKGVKCRVFVSVYTFFTRSLRQYDQSSCKSSFLLTTLRNDGVLASARGLTRLGQAEQFPCNPNSPRFSPLGRYTSIVQSAANMQAPPVVVVQ